MVYLYQTFIYEPLLNALVFFYNTAAFQDLGVAIIILTVAIRLILFPLFHKGARQQAVMQKIQPKLKEIQTKHSGDRERQAREMLALYKMHGVNPLSGFGILLVQLPVLIALYKIFLTSFTPEAFTGLYSFIKTPTDLNTTFLGLIPLKEKSILLVTFAAGVQFIQGRLALPPRSQGQSTLSPMELTVRRMVYVGPIITFVIFMTLPAAISLYWLITSLFSIAQQEIVNRELVKHGVERISHTTH